MKKNVPKCQITQRKIYKKAFTLTELIVVIVIIGVLAAVLIPSITGYLNKANLSNDTSVCKNMNTELNAYLTEHYELEGDLLDASDVRSILTSSSSKYTFSTKTASDGNYFWYDKANKKILLAKANELPVSSYSRVDQTVSELNLYPTIEEIVTGYLFLNTNGDVLADNLASLRSISSNSDYANISNNFKSGGTNILANLKGFTEEQINGLETHIEKFNPSETLYINDFSSFTSSSGTVKTIVYADGILTIPANATLNVTSITSTLKIPMSVKYIEAGAMTSINTLSNGVLILNQDIKISKDAENAEDNSFSEVIINNIQSNIYTSLGKVRSVPIAEIKTQLAYEKDKITEGDVTYTPYNMQIKPQVVIKTAEGNYKVDDVVGIDQWRIKYTTGADNSIKMEVKMFDDQGIIASTTIVYREITDLGIALSGSTISFDNIARLIYKDETVADQYVDNYEYRIYAGDNNLLQTVDAKALIGTIANLEIGDKEEAYTTLEVAQAKLASLLAIATKNGKSYVAGKEPTLSADNMMLSYEYQYNQKTVDESVPSDNTFTNDSKIVSYTREEKYEIKLDDSTQKYYISKTAVEKGENSQNIAVYYYMQNDKSDSENYDSLQYNFTGKDYFNTYIYDLIESSSIANLNQYIKDDKITIKVELCDKNAGVVIVEKKAEFALDGQERVFSETATDGQVLLLDYTFGYLPGYFVKGQDILKDYASLFVKEFTYIGNRSENKPGTSSIDYDTSKSYPSDIKYDLTDTSSAGYISLRAKLEGLKENGIIASDTDIDKVLKNGYFIKNESPDSDFNIDGITSSIVLRPSIFDPYFLVINLDTTTIGENTMLAIGIFDDLNSSSDDTYATTRIIELEYRVNESNDISLYCINGRPTNGAGTQSNPIIIYESEISDGKINLHPAVNSTTSQIAINSSTEQSLINIVCDVNDEIGNCLIVDNTLNGTNGSFVLRYYPDNKTYYNETTIYYQVIDENGLETPLQTINEMDVSQTNKLYLYDGQNIGLTSISALANYNNLFSTINFSNISSSCSPNNINQLVMTVNNTTKSTTDKYYFMRGDNFTDIGLNIEEMTGLRKVGDVTDITSANSCDKYYYEFTKNDETYRYYPYQVFYPTPANDVQANFVCVNRLEYLVIIQKNIGGNITYEFDILQTATSLIDGKYTPEEKRDINYFLDMSFKEADKGTIKFEQFAYFYYSCSVRTLNDGRRITPNKYYYSVNGVAQIADNYVLVNHYYDIVDYEVVSTDNLETNIHMAMLNNKTITNFGTNNVDSSVLFVEGEAITDNYHSYVTIIQPNMTNAKTIYALYGKQTTYLTYYVDGKRVDCRNSDIFNGKTSGTLTIEVNYYGLILKYDYKYLVADFLDLEINTILNHKYYGQTLELDLESKLISSNTDTYSYAFLYDKEAPNRILQNVYFCDYNIKLAIYQGNNKIADVSALDSAKTLKELGCENGQTYNVKVTYGSSSLKTEFKFKAVDDSQEVNYAKFGYINGRDAANNVYNSNNPFYFLTDELLKLPIGYDYPNGSTYAAIPNEPTTLGYVNKNFLSTYIYTNDYKSSQLIDLSKILGDFNVTTQTFDNVKFYIDDKEVTFVAEKYYHLQYSSSSYNSLKYVYHYRVTEEAISALTTDKKGVLKVDFTYEGQNYEASIPYIIDDFRITTIQGESNYYVSNNRDTNSMVFERTDELIFGESNYANYQYNVNYWTFHSAQTGALYTKGYNPNSTGHAYANLFKGTKYARNASSFSPTVQTFNSNTVNMTKVFKTIVINGYDSNGNLIADKVEIFNSSDSPHQNSFAFDDAKYQNIVRGEIIFTTDDGSENVFKYLIREDINDDEDGIVEFNKINNYCLDNYTDTQKVYYLEENENIYLNATNFYLPRNNGINNILMTAPTIWSSSSTAANNGRVALYYLTNEAIPNYDLDATNKFVDSAWKEVKATAGNASILDIWSVWNALFAEEDELTLCLVYSHNNDRVYKITVKLIKSSTESNKIGVRNINNVNYYSDSPVISLDKNNPIIDLTASSLWFNYSSIYKNMKTLSSFSNIAFSYSTDRITWTKINVVNNQVNLAAIATSEDTYYLKISNIIITDVLYKDVIVEMEFSELVAELERINGTIISDNTEIKFYKGEKLAIDSNSVLVYKQQSKATKVSFKSYVSSETTNALMLYYFEINDLDSIIEKELEDGQTERYYEVNGEECPIRTIKGKVYYQINNTSTWTIQESGELVVEYRLTAAGALSYFASCEITVVTQPENSNNVYELYYLDTETSTSRKISTTSNSKDTPNEFTYSQAKNFSITNSSNSYFNFTTASGKIEKVYLNNANINAMVYNIDESGNYNEGQDFILGESLLYNGEKFETEIEGYYYTSTKALVVNYELNGINYSITFYYRFNHYSRTV